MFNICKLTEPSKEVTPDKNLQQTHQKVNPILATGSADFSEIVDDLVISRNDLKSLETGQELTDIVSLLSTSIPSMAKQ